MSIFHNVLNNKTKTYSKWLNEPIICLSDNTFTIPDNYQYELLEVTEKYIARPDLLSSMIYGSTDYTDVICKINGISNPFELNAGMILIIPTPDAVSQFSHQPNSNDLDRNLNENIEKPKAKNKNTTRKANEAITSDSRFKIDKTNNVIVY